MYTDIYEGTKRVARVRFASVSVGYSAHRTEEIFINNYQGSPVVVLSSTGNIQYQKYLDPWGNLEMEIGSPSSDIEFQYTDKELDTETGLYNFWNRYRDPMDNRFYGRDRVHLEDDLKNYFGINPYVFANNNPIGNVDTDGNKGVMIQSGIEYVVNPIDEYKYYKTDIYPDLTPVASDMLKTKSIKPSATVWLSRDAEGTNKHPDLYGSERGTGEFGTNKEAPNMIYTLSPVKRNLANSGSDKILLTGATSKWGSGEAVENIPYKPRTGLTIEAYSPDYSLGCLQTGMGNKDALSVIKNELPDYMNPLDPAYLIKEPVK